MRGSFQTYLTRRPHFCKVWTGVRQNTFGNAVMAGQGKQVIYWPGSLGAELRLLFHGPVFFSFFFFQSYFILFIKLSLICNIVLVSVVQLQTFSNIGYYKILNLVPCTYVYTYSKALLFICFVYNGVYLLIPYS